MGGSRPGSFGVVEVGGCEEAEFSRSASSRSGSESDVS